MTLTDDEKFSNPSNCYDYNNTYDYDDLTIAPCYEDYLKYHLEEQKKSGRCDPSLTIEDIKHMGLIVSSSINVYDTYLKTKKAKSRRKFNAYSKSTPIL